MEILITTDAYHSTRPSCELLQRIVGILSYPYKIAKSRLITLDIAQQLIQVIEGYGVVPLVRVGENKPNLIKRVMDAGAYGVIVPMVNAKEHAEAAVNAVKYLPFGPRGVGFARAQGY